MHEHEERGRAARQPRRILNVLPSRDVEQDWRIENADAAGVLAAAAARLPAEKDLREQWWRVGDQKETGSCVGWATADAVVRWHLVRADRLDPGQRLSVRFVWMASKETDEFVDRPTTFIEEDGTSLKAALDVVRKYGAVLDKDLPFGEGTLFAGSAKTFYALASKFRISHYFNLGQDLASWRRWLATQGPILTRLVCDSTWFNATEAKGRLDRYKPETASGGHAVALVGYGPGRFIVRNSWGTGWGDEGYAYASLGYAQQAFTEAYGIAV